jgi:glycosyltransferase involved in cell wall biosynthesis
MGLAQSRDPLARLDSGGAGVHVAASAGLDSRKDRASSARRRRIAVVASLTFSLTNFRLELLRRMVEAGHEVVAFAPDRDRPVIERLGEIGVRFVRIPMSRAGINPLQDARTVLALTVQLARSRPDVILAYTMKPIIYGLLAARLTGVRERFALVTGLGQIFARSDRRRRAAVLRRLSVALYRAALAGSQRVFVYNDADRDDLLAYRMVDGRTALVSVPGSGVDLDHFTFSPPPAGAPRFLLVARLLKNKGIADYVEAARRLRARHPHIEVRLIGPFDPSPNGVPRVQLAAWIEAGTVEYLGETRDIRPVLTSASVLVLPSYYREGIPRSLLEGLAVGRAIITTDLPGCRQTVVSGENGFLVPPRDPERLARAMEAFVEDESLAVRMGRRSRELAVEKFDVHAVNRLVLSEMGLVA